jgi:hypothetical protein
MACGRIGGEDCETQGEKKAFSRGFVEMRCIFTFLNFVDIIGMSWGLEHCINSNDLQ